VLMDFRRVIASPDIWLFVVGRLGKSWSPRVLMPNPKVRHRDAKSRSRPKDAKKRFCRVPCQKAGIIQPGIGKGRASARDDIEKN